jgi:hypothetical protein
MILFWSFGKPPHQWSQNLSVLCNFPVYWVKYFRVKDPCGCILSRERTLGLQGFAWWSFLLHLRHEKWPWSDFSVELLHTPSTSLFHEKSTNDSKVWQRWDGQVDKEF